MADLTDEQLAEIRADMADARRCEHELRTQPSMITVRGLVAGCDLLLRALRDARADVERISGAWCEVIQREQRSDNAHWYDMTQLEAERDLLRAEAELHRIRGDRLQRAIELALEDMGTSTLGAHILRAALAAPTEVVSDARDELLQCIADTLAAGEQAGVKVAQAQQLLIDAGLAAPTGQKESNDR